MANNVNAFKTELLNLFSTTANLDSSTKTKIRNRFVSAYQTEWQNRVASGTTDNAANRAAFAIDKIAEHIANIYSAQHRAEQLAELPAAETL